MHVFREKTLSGRDLCYLTFAKKQKQNKKRQKSAQAESCGLERIFDGFAVHSVFMFICTCVCVQVRDIALSPEMFSVQNGLLTPTLKAKRAELKNHFREQIDQLYAKIKM